MYYNTNSLFGEELKEAVKVTNNQDELCLEVFRKHQCSFSACQVWRMITGLFGKPVHTYKLK